MVNLQVSSHPSLSVHSLPFTFVLKYLAQLKQNDDVSYGDYSMNILEKKHYYINVVVGSGPTGSELHR